MSQFGLKTDPDSGKFNGYTWDANERKPTGNLRIYSAPDIESRSVLNPLDDFESLANGRLRSSSPRFEDPFEVEFENLRLGSGERKPWQSPSKRSFDFIKRPRSEDKPGVKFDLNFPNGLDSHSGNTFSRNHSHSGFEAPVSLGYRQYGPSASFGPQTATSWSSSSLVNNTQTVGYRQYGPSASFGPQTATSWSSSSLVNNTQTVPNVTPRVSTNPFLPTSTLGFGSGMPNAVPYPVSANPQGYSLANTVGGTVSMRRKEIEPDYYDGSADLNDYLEHFEQVAEYNNWSDDQRARALCTKLKGDARKILRSLSAFEKTDYGLLQLALAREFDMQEMVMAHRSVYKNRRRKKDETVAQFGFELRRLAQKAYPALSLRELEVHIIDQYLEGLGDKELRKHVQLHHPQTLSQAIGLAVEYCSVDNPHEKLLKPTKEQDETAFVSGEKTRAVNSLRPLKLPNRVFYSGPSEHSVISGRAEIRRIA